MTEQDIIQLFQQKRQWEAELSIIRDCSDELHDFSSAEQAMRFALLKRRLSLIEHWLDYVSSEERTIIQLHLIQKKPWSYIVNQMGIESPGSFPCDERTLQRLQARAIQNICNLMYQSFGNRLDYLLENNIN